MHVCILASSIPKNLEKLYFCLACSATNAEYKVIIRSDTLNSTEYQVIVKLITEHLATLELRT